MLRESVTIAVTLIGPPGRGWVAHAAEVRAVAQGATREEALDEMRSDASRQLELVTL